MICTTIETLSYVYISIYTHKTVCVCLCMNSDMCVILIYVPLCIDWYIGTERGMADVLPRTEVSFNASQRAEIDGDLLYLNGVRFATLSEVSREDGGEDGGEGGGGFALEPGRVVFNTLELCNFVHRCVEVGTSPSILIRESSSLHHKA